MDHRINFSDLHDKYPNKSNIDTRTKRGKLTSETCSL